MPEIFEVVQEKLNKLNEYNSNKNKKRTLYAWPLKQAELEDLVENAKKANKAIELLNIVTLNIAKKNCLFKNYLFCPLTNEPTDLCNKKQPESCKLFFEEDYCERQ
jgi:hypothetical protein